MHADNIIEHAAEEGRAYKNVHRPHCERLSATESEILHEVLV